MQDHEADVSLPWLRYSREASTLMYLSEVVEDEVRDVNQCLEDNGENFQLYAKVSWEVTGVL